MLSRLFGAIFLTVVVASSVLAADAKEQSWSGKSFDSKLKQLAPESGAIVDGATWKKVWSAWRPMEELPEVDFAKELVLVGTVSGPNLVIMRPVVSDGNVKFIVGGTKIGGPGFGYKLIKMDRAGIKTVNGKPIDAKGAAIRLVIPKKVASFDGQTLEIKLWEYDPFLADASATLVDEVVEQKFSHTEGKATRLDFTLGEKLEPRKDRGYYVTLFVLQDGQRTHMGELDGKPGLAKVLTDGHPAAVKMIVRPVR